MKTYKLEVYGRAQGVNFRNSVKRKCSGKLNGSVMNREDGSVVIIVQGKEMDIEDLIKWMKGNPGFSRVDRVRKSEIDVEKLNGFVIWKNSDFFRDQKNAIGNFGKKLFG
jgi:acylphosphatase